MASTNRGCISHEHLWASGNRPPRRQRCARHHWEAPLPDGPRRGVVVTLDACEKCGKPTPPDWPRRS